MAGEVIGTMQTDIDDLADKIETLLRSDHGPRLARLMVARATASALTGTESSLVMTVQIEVARMYGVTLAEVLGRSRSASASRARRVAMFIVREWTGASYPEIGRMFGRDHTTVISACRSAAAMRDANGVATVERVMSKLANLRNSHRPATVGVSVREDATRC